MVYGVTDFVTVCNGLQSNSYTGRIAVCQSCCRGTNRFLLSTVQPGTIRFFRKGCDRPVDFFQKNQTESNKSLTYQLLIQATNIEILIQHGTGIMVQTTQETVEARMKKYES